MPITPLSGGGGIDVVWGDFSGGIIEFVFQHPSYNSHHQFRVIPFDTAGTGLFTAPPVSTTSGLQQEADNLAALLAACYAADTTVSAVFALQTLADHSGDAPYPFSFANTSTAVGTGGGTSEPVPNVISFNSRGADGSRWRLALPGSSTSTGTHTAGKTAFPSTGGAILALAQYLTGQTNGGVHAVKTNVVTHNGVPISFSAGSVTSIINKRLRRHFGLV